MLLKSLPQGLIGCVPSEAASFHTLSVKERHQVSRKQGKNEDKPDKELGHIDVRRGFFRREIEGLS